MSKYDRFKLDRQGVHVHDDEKGEFVRLCDPIEVIALTRDFEDENWGRVLKFKDPDSKEHTLALPARAFDRGGWIGPMLSDGCVVPAGRAERDILEEYLQAQKPKERWRCVPKIGWAPGGCYVLPDVTIGPDGEEPVIFQSPHASEHRFRVSGSIGDWRKHVAASVVPHTL